MPKRPVAQEPLTLDSVVVSGPHGQPVQVDANPRCPVCGKKLGEYFGLPWSIKCRNCGHQAKRE
jgi:tRNA(Ile2) C34 agmatinyltransferase TiaS